MSVWLPTWSTDLIRRGIRRANPAPVEKRGRMRPGIILLTAQLSGREIVVRRCLRSAECGVAPGMDLAQARSLLPARAAMHVEAHRPEREAAALHGLACWALRYSPMVAADPPDGLLIDATGMEGVYPGRGEVGLNQAITAALQRWGLASRIAVASTFAGAWAAARFGRSDAAHVPPGQDRAALAPLPVEALRIDLPTVLALQEIGLTHIGDVLNLPRAALVSRFGAELLRRLSYVLGTATEIIEPVRPEPPLRAELLFEGPTERWEAVEAAAREVLDGVIAQLLARGQGTRQLDLEVLRPHGVRERFPLRLSHASRAPKHLWSLLRASMERIDMGAGVEGIAITIPRPERFIHRQSALGALGSAIETTHDETTWGELIDNLVSHLGASGVVRFELVESHLPERAFRERAIMESTAARSSAAMSRVARPTRLFQPPRPVRVLALTPDGPILSVGWEGRERRAISCMGPERIGPEWWHWQPDAARGSPPPERDYFVVQMEDGSWVWICRQVGTGRWFVQGDWA